MDKKKLSVVGMSFCLGALAMYSYVWVRGAIDAKKEQNAYLASIYGQDYVDTYHKGIL